MHFHQIALMGTHRNPLVGESILHLFSLLQGWGCKVWVERDSAEGLAIPSEHRVDFTADQTTKMDLLIAVGGDGNLLHAGRLMAGRGVPVLGVNRGQLGFLTDLSPLDLEGPLKAILKGEYQREERFLLSAEIVQEEGAVVKGGIALNDIVLFPGEVAQLIEFDLRIDGQFVYSQRSDGLIIATPTGSTAYALSAGGPIMAPHLEVMVLVPKLPHTLTSRPVVIGANSQIELRLATGNKTAPRLSYDGQEHCTLRQTDRVLISRSPASMILLHPIGYNYYDTWRKKLQWGTQLIPLEGALDAH